MEQPPNPYSQGQPQQQWQQQNTSWGSSPHWQQAEPLPPPYPQQMPLPQPQWQQPYYPPPNQPSQKSHNAFKLGLGIGCGIMAAFAIGIVVLAILASAGRQNSTAQEQFATQPASQTTSVPTQTIFKIGDTATNTLWSVTLNSVKIVTSGPYAQPGAGDIFLVVDVTMQNLASSPQIVSVVPRLLSKIQQGKYMTRSSPVLGFHPIMLHFSRMTNYVGKFLMKSQRTCTTSRFSSREACLMEMQRPGRLRFNRMCYRG